MHREEEENVAEAHPQTPGKGAGPLCTPHIINLLGEEVFMFA